MPNLRRLQQGRPHRTVRQPMHAQGLFVAQLRSHITSPDGSRVVDRIDEALNGMNELFNALLDITKLDAGPLTPTIGEFPIAELLARIGSTFAPVAQEKGLSFRSVLSRVWVRSDPVLLERIVLNLVSNAVRYTAAGGIVVAAAVAKTTCASKCGTAGPASRRISSARYSANSTGWPMRPRPTRPGRGSASLSSIASAPCSIIRSN
jgi:signal transduction histidine kinase